MLNKNIKKIKTLMLGLVGVMALSMIQLPAVHAADSCFVTRPYQENIMSDPLHSDVFYVGIASACEMKLYDMDVSFTDINSVEGLIPIHSDSHDNLSNVKEFNGGLRMKWSGNEDEQEDSDYIQFNSSDDSWDYLFGRWYIIPISSLNPPATFKRNLPITINSARYEVNGEMRTVENLVLDSVATVAQDSNKDVLAISGVGKQDVSYTSQPVVLDGELTVEGNNDGITADDLTEKYYLYDYSDLAFTPIERPTDPGQFYLVEYTFENDNYRAALRVPFTIKDYVTVSTDVWSGHGEVSAPLYVDRGGSMHVDIAPEEGSEILWVKYNDNDVTDQLNDDNSLDIETVNENANIVVAFRAVYQVTDGDGGEHVRKSGNDLAFMVDKDPASYTSGIVTIAVDGEYVDLDNDSMVNPEARTVTLLSDYLDTLATGNHYVEIFFFDTSVAGIARASFTVVEATIDEEGESNGESKSTEESELALPNTGMFTGGDEGDHMEIAGIVVAIAAVVSVLCFALIRKFSKRS